MEKENMTQELGLDGQILSVSKTLVSKNQYGIENFKCVKPFDSSLTSSDFRKNIDILLEVAADMIRSQRKQAGTSAEKN